LKKLVALLLLAGILAVSPLVKAQESEYRTVTLSGTADVLIDSSLTTSVTRNKRVAIKGIYAFYDNAANTNQFNVQIVRGTSALRVANSQRVFRYAVAMTSGGYGSYTFEPNLVADADSVIYFVINAASSDSLYLAVTYKLVP